MVERFFVGLLVGLFGDLPSRVLRYLLSLGRGDFFQLS
jgi:hypothetical protein